MKQYALNADVLDQWHALTGRTSAELAKMARINHTSLSKWRNGSRPIPLAAAEELAAATGIPRARLIRLVDDAPAPPSARERMVEEALGNAIRPHRRADTRATA